MLYRKINSKDKLERKGFFDRVGCYVVFCILIWDPEAPEQAIGIDAG